MNERVVRPVRVVHDHDHPLPLKQPFGPVSFIIKTGNWEPQNHFLHEIFAVLSLPAAKSVKTPCSKSFSFFTLKGPFTALPMHT